jgi:tetratricopeptide (TPR) repeat protein
MLLVLLAVAALAAGCSNPEKAKAEYLSRGEALLKEGKYQEATIEFRNAIQIDDRLAAAHWGLSQAYEKMGSVSEAMDELQKTVQLDPDNAPARIKLGNAYIIAYDRMKKAEFLSEAERLAGEILAKDDKNIDGHILLANVLHLKGDEVGALAKINHAISLDPQRVESYIALAKYYVQTNRLDQAEAAYTKAISINDRSSLAHIEYGKFFSQTNRADRAEAEFTKAVESDPQSRDARWVLASFYLVNKRFDRAEEAFKQYAQLDWDKPEGRARLADFYATVGRYDDASKLYQEIVNWMPDYTRGRYRLGELMLQRGDVGGATAQIEELLKRAPNDLEALLLRARMRIAGNQLKEAIGDLKTVLAQSPRSQLGLYFMTEALYRDGQIEEARKRAGELERYSPDFLPAKLIQVQINFDSGDPDAARRLATDLLDRIAKTAPTGQQSPQLLADLKTNALLLRGKANLALKQLPAARADIEAASAVMPNSPLPYVNMADVAFASGNRQEALQNLERALSIDRTNYQALNGLLNLMIAERRFDEVRSRLEGLIAEQPNNASLHYLRAQAYYNRSSADPADAARAEESLKRALELNPDYVPAYVKLADLYFSLQQPDRAIAEYRKITERRPDNAEAYTYIAMIESGRNNLDAAEQNYRRALSLNPGEKYAANNLAMLYADYGKGNGDEAMRLAQDIVRREPENPGFADTLGWVYYKKGLHAAAVEQLSKAVKFATASGGDNSLYRFHLGMALAGKGDKAGAKRELQKSLQLADEEQKRPLKSPTTTPVDEARRTLASL